MTDDLPAGAGSQGTTPGSSSDANDLHPHSGKTDGRTSDSLDHLLESIDQTLLADERAFDKKAAERRHTLEAEHTQLSEKLLLIAERAARAEAISSRDVLVKLESYRLPIESKLQAVVAELGYDPKLRAEEEERKRRESFERDSHSRMSQFLSMIGDIVDVDEIDEVQDEACRALCILTLNDGTRVLKRLREISHGMGAGLHPLVEAYVQSLTRPGEIAERKDAYARLQESLASEFEERDDASERLRAIRSESALLEQEAPRLSTTAVYHKVHELCCRAKLVQIERGAVLTADQAQGMRREIFGKLKNVKEQANTGYVPSLLATWHPDDYADEIAKAKKGYEEALQSAGDHESPDNTRISGFQLDTETPVGLEDSELHGRLHEAEQWVLAEVYRQTNKHLDEPSSLQVLQALKLVVMHAREFLKGNDRRLAEVLIPAREVFETGKDFRWLRNQFKRLDKRSSESEEESGAIEEAETPSASVETLSGENPLHPSIHAVRRWTREKRIMVLGGVAEETLRMDLQSILEAKEVTWYDYERNGSTNKIQQAAQRLARDKFDYVVYLLGYLSHTATGLCDDAAKSSGTPIARVHRGKGPVGIAEAIRLASVRASAPS